MAKASAKKQESGIEITEWSLSAFLHTPSPVEVDETVQAIIASGDLLRTSTVQDDAAFSLLLRDRHGLRIFKDGDISMLSTRPRHIIDDVVSREPKLVEQISAAIKNAQSKWKVKSNVAE